MFRNVLKPHVKYNPLVKHQLVATNIRIDFSEEINGRRCQVDCVWRDRNTGEIKREGSFKMTRREAMHWLSYNNVPYFVFKGGIRDGSGYRVSDSGLRDYPKEAAKISSICD